MAIPDYTKVYPRTGDTQTVYLKNVVNDPAIHIGAFTIYHDFVHDPRDFQKNNVLYHYPINGDHLRIGKFCSIACGARFLFNSANHTMGLGQQGRHCGGQRRVDRLRGCHPGGRHHRRRRSDRHPRRGHKRCSILHHCRRRSSIPDPAEISSGNH